MSRIDTILDITRRLTALLEREIGMIEARTPARLAELEDERNRLSLLYSREMQAVAADAAEFRALPQDRIGALREETKTFHDLLGRHQRMVARMRRVTEGIVKTIADEAQRQKSPRTGYAPSGRTSAGSTAAPLAINSRI
ncbi:MAG: hypothetical protein QM698_17125 [Micropepsaceae bacterium]